MWEAGVFLTPKAPTHLLLSWNPLRPARDFTGCMRIAYEAHRRLAPRSSQPILVGDGAAEFYGRQNEAYISCLSRMFRQLLHCPCNSSHPMSQAMPPVHGETNRMDDCRRYN